MRIELVSLENERGGFAHTYAPGELVLQDERVSILEPPEISGKIRKNERRVYVSGRLTGQVQVECDRCLKLIELPVDSHFKLEYVTAEDYQAQQAFELTEEDLDLSVFDGEVIEIDELVTEELLLAIPDQVLCSDSCKGMCAVCGVNRNTTECSCESPDVDPRWAGLKELMN
jgi:uncharacterized protein